MFWSFLTHFKYLILNNNYMPWDMSNLLFNSEIVWMVDNGLSGGFPLLTLNVIFFVIQTIYLSSPPIDESIHNPRTSYFDISKSIHKLVRLFTKLKIT